jgi:hypothetical protein
MFEKIGALIATLLKGVFRKWKSQQKRYAAEKNVDRQKPCKAPEAFFPAHEDASAMPAGRLDESKAGEIQETAPSVRTDAADAHNRRVELNVAQAKVAAPQDDVPPSKPCDEQEIKHPGNALLRIDTAASEVLESGVATCAETASANHQQMRGDHQGAAEAVGIYGSNRALLNLIYLKCAYGWTNRERLLKLFRCQESFQALPPEIHEDLPILDGTRSKERAEMSSALSEVNNRSKEAHRQDAADSQIAIGTEGKGSVGTEDASERESALEFQSHVDPCADADRPNGNPGIFGNVVSDLDVTAQAVDLHAEPSEPQIDEGHEGETPMAVEANKVHGSEGVVRMLGEQPTVFSPSQPGVTASARSNVVAHQGAGTQTEWDGFSERVQVGASAVCDPCSPGPVKIDDEATCVHLAAGAEAKPIIEHRKKPSAPTDISEYHDPATDLGAASLPDEYLRWNKILFTRFIAVGAQARIHLAVSPRLLAAALADETGERVAPPEAERRLAEAVKMVYRTHVVGSSARLRILRRCSRADGLPLCVAFLALSVLAAHKMHSDQEASSGAYYFRLASLLDAERVAGDLPKDFRTEEFASLWHFLADWLAKTKSLSLVLPEADVQRRYIAYPLVHVPLRQLDLDKLPLFFDWAGYSPETAVSPERVADDLRRWGQSYGLLSDAGKDALLDDRLPAVVAQVQSELRAWNRLLPVARGVQHVQVEILLEPAGRRSRLLFLAPRREGYPQVFRAGEIELTGGESWYDPLELCVDSSDVLLHGFSWASEGDPMRVLYRAPMRVAVLAPNSDYSGFVSRSNMPKDTLCAVLCHEAAVESVRAYLAGICDSSPRALQENGFPREWRLFSKIRAVRIPESVPGELRPLDVASQTDIIPVGGLRLGSQWAWMEGTPPRVLIEGHEGRPVYVDDKPIELDDEGFLKADGVFSKVGTYNVRVGSLEKKVRVVRPELRPSTVPPKPTGENAACGRNPIVLPTGVWVLVGPHPCQVLPVSARGPRNSLVFCDFKPAWAIQVGSGRGAKAIRIAALPVEHSDRLSRSPNAARWTSAIYEAAIRRPAIRSQVGDSPRAAARAWMAYAEEARHLKRRWKKRES